MSRMGAARYLKYGVAKTRRRHRFLAQLGRPQFGSAKGKSNVQSVAAGPHEIACCLRLPDALLWEQRKEASE